MEGQVAGFVVLACVACERCVGGRWMDGHLKGQKRTD